MSIRDLIRRIGTTGLTGQLAIDRLGVPVRVVDAREVFGRVDFLVQPIGGTGEQWVESGRVIGHGAASSCPAQIALKGGAQ